MARADAVEVSFDGGERAGTRLANSTITTNLVQYDQQLTVNVRHGQKQGSASTRELDDESLKAAVDEAQEAAQKARDNPNLRAARERSAGIRPGRRRRRRRPRTSVPASAPRG